MVALPFFPQPHTSPGPPPTPTMIPSVATMATYTIIRAIITIMYSSGPSCPFARLAAASPGAAPLCGQSVVRSAIGLILGQHSILNLDSSGFLRHQCRRRGAAGAAAAGFDIGDGDGGLARVMRTKLLVTAFRTREACKKHDFVLI